MISFYFPDFLNWLHVHGSALAIGIAVGMVINEIFNRLQERKEW